MTEPFDFVLGQMNHLGYKNWDCGCKRNAATAVMTRNYPREELEETQITPFRAIACGDSYSDPVRVAAMLAEKPWDEVIIVGDRHGPLYDNLRVVKTLSDLPPIDSFDCNKRTLVIFDECCATVRGKADMKVIYDFSIRGRMRGVSTLFVEMSFLEIPKLVRKNADILYLTTDPRRGWKEIKWLLLGDAPIAECFAALSRPHRWFKIDMISRETEAIDAAKYYP